MAGYDSAVAYDGALAYDEGNFSVALTGPAASGIPSRRRTAQEFRDAYYRKEPVWHEIDAKRRQRLEAFLRNRGETPAVDMPKIFVAEEKMRPVAVVFENIEMKPRYYELELLMLSQWV